MFANWKSALAQLGEKVGDKFILMVYNSLDL